MSTDHETNREAKLAGEVRMRRARYQHDAFCDLCDKCKDAFYRGEYAITYEIMCEMLERNRKTGI
jgi:hypothetical protein